ncbi:MAG: ester cyclase [Tepidiformaceae bacterium]
MSQQAETVARACLESFNKADWAAMKGTLAANSVYEEYGTQRNIQGADAILAAFQAWKVAMPDVTGTVRNVFASGETVALELMWQGTHTGPLETPGGSIPASGKQQKTPGIWSIDVRDGKVQSSRQYFDMLTFLQQIGAAPA